MPGSFCTVCRQRISKGSRCATHATQSPSSRNARTAKWVREIRPRILARDNYACADCEATVHLEVHHLDGDPQNNRAENLLTLCDKCHMERHRQADKLYFMSPT
jgi:5-methylcytosine-specific restriction endonuclease McrA